MSRAILTINSGSSSLKASFFSAGGKRRDFHYGHVHDTKSAFQRLREELGDDVPEIVGHRFVHGGDVSEAARMIDEAERSRLENLIHLAPLHMPGNLLGVDLSRKHFAVPQIACFDTAFHSTLANWARRLPIPAELGQRRYGFHGINYAYIARELPKLLGDAAYGRVVVAHLGSGASLCLLENLESVDTTMGYTPAGGIVMGTRSGDLDPGLMLELGQRLDDDALSDMVYHKMGLIALSDGESSEMQDLLASSSEAARFAVDYFCRRARAAVAALAAMKNGIDALIFTGGIGEHAPEVRAGICESLGFMGVLLDDEANRSGAGRIEQKGSIPILIVPADEEKMIYDLCIELMHR